MTDTEKSIHSSAGARARSIFLALWFNNIAHTAERMFGLNFAGTLIPILRQIYRDPAQLAAAIKRHMGFCVAEPTTGMCINGMLAAQEERRANGDLSITAESMQAMKNGMMGAVSGFGDTLFTGTIRPLAVVLFLPLGMQGIILGSIGFLLMETVARMISGVYWFRYGYRSEMPQVVQKIIQSTSRLKGLRSVSQRMSLIILGMIACLYLASPVEKAALFAESASLPWTALVIPLLVYVLLTKKVKVTHLVLGITALGILLSLLGAM